MFHAAQALFLFGFVQCGNVETMEDIRARLGNPFPELKNDVNTLSSAVDQVKMLINGIFECGIPKQIHNANADVTIKDGKLTVIYNCQRGIVLHGSVQQSSCNAGTWSDIPQVCADLKDCYMVEGQKAIYSGTTSTTENGYTCQKWTSQIPNEHSQTEENFPNTNGIGNETMESASNYCRDPDGEGFPWCYTTSPLSRYEGCDIPPC